MALGLIGKEQDIELNLEENMLTKKFLLGQITGQTSFQLGDHNKYLQIVAAVMRRRNHIWRI